MLTFLKKVVYLIKQARQEKFFENIIIHSIYS